MGRKRRAGGRKEKKSEQVMGFMEAAYSSAGIDKPQEAQGPWVNSPKACSDSPPYLDAVSPIEAEVSTHQKIETFFHLSQLSPCRDAFQSTSSLLRKAGVYNVELGA